MMMDLHFNEALAEGYKQGSQRARILTEDWTARNVYCPICGAPVLHHYENNRPVADFLCPQCKADFELKSKQSATGELGRKVDDGQYDTMIARITSLKNPNFFFLTYDDFQVNNLFIVPNHFFTPNVIEKRKPLALTARRAGWTGCNILISDIPQSAKIYLIKEREELAHEQVIAKYQRAKSLVKENLESRGWVMDVLNCVDRIGATDFSLADVYAFEPLLQAKHPLNNNVRAKIRQQLQFLRDGGYLTFTSRGQYRKI